MDFTDLLEEFIDLRLRYHGEVYLFEDCVRYGQLKDEIDKFIRGEKAYES